MASQCWSKSKAENKQLCGAQAVFVLLEYTVHGANTGLGLLGTNHNVSSNNDVLCAGWWCQEDISLAMFQFYSYGIVGSSRPWHCMPAVWITYYVANQTPVITLKQKLKYRKFRYLPPLTVNPLKQNCSEYIHTYIHTGRHFASDCNKKEYFLQDLVWFINM